MSDANSESGDASDLHANSVTTNEQCSTQNCDPAVGDYFDDNEDDTEVNEDDQSSDLIEVIESFTDSVTESCEQSNPESEKSTEDPGLIDKIIAEKVKQAAKEIGRELKEKRSREKLSRYTVQEINLRRMVDSRKKAVQRLRIELGKSEARRKVIHERVEHMMRLLERELSLEDYRRTKTALTEALHILV